MENIKKFNFDEVDLSKGLSQYPYNFATYEYDNNGNMIHSKAPNEESFKVYDSKNRLIYWKIIINKSIREYLYEYDDMGNHTYTRKTDGKVVDKNEYDDFGRVIFNEDHHGRKAYEYDDNGNLIIIRYVAPFSSNVESGSIYKQMFYDDKGNKIREEFLSTGVIREYEYDEKGNEILYRGTNDVELRTYYDENNMPIYAKSNKGYEIWNKYDESGRKIMSVYKVS